MWLLAKGALCGRRYSRLTLSGRYRHYLLLTFMNRLRVAAKPYLVESRISENRRCHGLLQAVPINDIYNDVIKSDVSESRHSTRVLLRTPGVRAIRDRRRQPDQRSAASKSGLWELAIPIRLRFLCPASLARSTPRCDTAGAIVPAISQPSSKCLSAAETKAIVRCDWQELSNGVQACLRP